ncbi:MAG: PAS domain-containing protein, partial [Acidobacteriota bacterium]|nr:PAS domain-containing protein [Acidobacteriota bacterium]
IQEQFWGFIGFDDCRHERVFTGEEEKILRSSSLLIANAVVRNEMTQSIKEKEDYIRLMLDASPVSCLIFDADMNVLECNEAAVRLYGLEDKKAYIERFFELSPEYQPYGERSADLAVAFINKAFEGERCVFDWMHQTPDGTLIPAEITLVRVQHGKDYVVAGYARDMRQIREAEERMRLMLDSSPLCCQIWDKNMNVLDCNEAAVRLYGVKDKQEYVERFFEFSPERQPDGQISGEKAKIMVTKAFAVERCTFDWTHQTPDGTTIPAEITLVRVKLGDDFVVVGYTRDKRE